MTRRSGRLAVPPIRKAEFRDEARDAAQEIAWRRKSHVNQDVGGHILRLMEKAYRQGLEDADAVADGETGPVASPGNAEPLVLRLLPAGSRKPFLMICLFGYGECRSTREPERTTPTAWLEWDEAFAPF